MNNSAYSLKKDKAISIAWIVLGAVGVCYESYRTWETVQAFGSFYYTFLFPYMPFVVAGILAMIAGTGGLARKRWARYVLAVVSALGIAYSAIIIVLFLLSIPTMKWEYFRWRIEYSGLFFLLILSVTTIVTSRRIPE